MVEPGPARDRPSRIAQTAPYAACLALLALYAVVRQARTLPMAELQLLTELPLVAYLLVLLAAPLRTTWLRWPAAVLPLLAFYLVHDEFLVRWGDVPNFSDFALLSDLFEVLSGVESLLVALGLALPIVLWLALVDFRRLRPSRTAFLLVAPVVAIGLALFFAPGRLYGAVSESTRDTEWSNKRGASEFGRLYAALVREARRRSFAEGLTGFTPLSRSEMTLDRALLSALDGRNVHIIVLESFVDLRLLRAVRFSSPPYAPELATLADDALSSAISPVFGGETARAEFEVLCGVPSLRLRGLEFLAFSGHRTYCLPTILHEAGYRTVLSFPHGPVFFNTRRAYPALGFDQVIYGAPWSPVGAEAIDVGDQDYLFDGDLYAQNLAKVKKLVAAKKPFLNYVMTIYGHWPFDIDTERFPRTIRPSVDDEDLARIADQMLERTKALHTYVRTLVELDPNAIMLFVADHLPPLPNGKDDYRRYGYASRSGLAPSSPHVPHENFLLVFERGRPVHLPRMRHFDLPHWVLNELSHGAYCREKRCAFGDLEGARETFLERYRTILGLATQPPDAP